MPFDNSRFALLAILCGFAAQSLSPYGGAGVRSAVVHRHSKEAHANQVARRDIGKVADYDAASLNHNQASFSFPWSRRGHAPSKQFEVRRSQKSTITISNGHGAKYVINHRRQATTPEWISAPRNGTSNSTASTSSSSDGRAGTVAIVSRNSYRNNDRVLASLFLVKQSDGTYVLDASDRNATEVFLTALPTTPSSDGTNDTYPVKLTIPLNGEPYCATYDQAPPNPEPLTAQRCMGDGVRTGHTSQIFIYNSSSGVIQPTYFEGQSIGDGDLSSASSLGPSSASPSASMGAANADVVTSSDSAFPTPSTSASSASWNKRDDSGSYTAQNVTLVFVPNRMASNVAAAAVQEVSTSTVTSTQTVIVFSSSASPPASTVRAADVTPSPVVSSSGSAVMAGATGLSVEVVGLPQAPVALPSMVAAPGRPGSPPAPSNSPSPSVGAAEVAASSSASSAPSLSAAWVASVSASDNSASMSAAPASSSAKALFERNAAVSKVTPVSTEPYSWRFKAEGGL